MLSRGCVHTPCYNYGGLLYYQREAAIWCMFFPPLQRLLYPPILPGASDGNAGELLILSQVVGVFWMWVSFYRAVAAGTSHRLQADTVFLTLADPLYCHHGCLIFTGLSSALAQIFSVSANISQSLFIFSSKGSCRNTVWLQYFYMRLEIDCYRSFQQCDL